MGIGTNGAAGLTIDGHSLTVDDVVTVARRGSRIGVELDPGATARVEQSRTLKRDLIATGQPIYGVTTGFGDSVTSQISSAKTAELQRNIARYHLNGTGPMAAPEVVRGTILIRANCLARGNSGIRAELINRLLEYLNHDVRPEIPERGSVGASGDLVPLCYLASAVFGEGQVRYRGRLRPTAGVLGELALSPIVPEAKDGLALINGTSFSASFASLALADAQRVALLAELCTAMASEALCGNRGHFHHFIHDHKPHPGQRDSAAAIAELLVDSGLALDHDQVLGMTGGLGDSDYARLPRSIQDKYSIRCAPQVIGILRDTASWARNWLDIEINSSNDNPLFDASETTVHNGGNFYAGHIGQAMDSIKTAVANIADLLDRQLELIVDEKFNNGLTPNLVARFEPGDWRAGLHHGFKGMQIACSAITAEALKNSAPASIFSRSTEAHNQDKVSMAPIAARDARTVIALVEEVLAIHLIALCQAIELRGLDRASRSARLVHKAIREHVPFNADDRGMDVDIAAVLQLIRSDTLSGIVNDLLHGTRRPVAVTI
ncbi:histidine ammonia-lyase [Nocardia sp. NPDC056100]|uniref:HAL/PAL/TAL family ammonia-lyase n=1 Tax=Nocardia sp. NPDC056100 TaxID=3345712 RepID=UPI0035E0309A